MLPSITNAHEMIEAEKLGDTKRGEGVNVVIVDDGLNRDWIESHYGTGRFGEGWKFEPGTFSASQRQLCQPGTTLKNDAKHALMIAANVLSLAPKAVLWDLPLIPPAPPGIVDLPKFLGEAQTAFEWMLKKIKAAGGNWVLVNAWAIFNLESESPPRSYTENIPSPSPLHPFTKLIDEAVESGIDVVFCAGNCGMGGDPQRCGSSLGPRRSIWGANSFHRVLTVGAVDTNRQWLDYSSQGPGPTNLGKKPGKDNLKPDLCGPSEFINDVSYAECRGTSAASGVVAGVVAALRSRWPSHKVSPEKLIEILNKSTQKLVNTTWDPNYGYGIINVRETIKRLTDEHP